MQWLFYCSFYFVLLLAFQLLFLMLFFLPSTPAELFLIFYDFMRSEAPPISSLQELLSQNATTANCKRTTTGSRYHGKGRPISGDRLKLCSEGHTSMCAKLFPGPRGFIKVSCFGGGKRDFLTLRDR